MQRFLISCGIFLGSGLISDPSPLFIKSALYGQQSSPIKYQAKGPFQKNLIQTEATRQQTTVTQEGQVEKAILILETRYNRITVYSGDNCLLYTVSSGGGVVLAERLKGLDLKARFPELYDIVTGTAWAGEIHMP
jgi:hypothetical protein